MLTDIFCVPPLKSSAEATGAPLRNAALKMRTRTAPSSAIEMHSTRSVIQAETLMPRTMMAAPSTAATTRTETIAAKGICDVRPADTTTFDRYVPTATRPAMPTDAYPTIADHPVGTAISGPSPRAV